MRVQSVGTFVPLLATTTPLISTFTEQPPVPRDRTQSVTRYLAPLVTTMLVVALSVAPFESVDKIRK
jgi:hypothetical protein